MVADVRPRSAHAATGGFDVAAVQKDFPILSRTFNGKRLVYLDSGATSHRPEQVVQAEMDLYRKSNANVHRGIYDLSEEATVLFEAARDKIQGFIHAPAREECVWTRGTTESLNLLATVIGSKMEKGDEVVGTVMEHHSNHVPWQFLQKRGIVLKHVDIDEEGRLRLDQYEQLVTDRTKVVTVTQVSNVLGTINPIREIARIAHRHGALCIVDGAQSVPHLPEDVRALECDALAFSGHKMLGPTGIGLLWARRELLEKWDPFLGGGDMIRSVQLKEATWNELPYKFEAGTPNIAGVVGLGAAVDYLQRLGMENVRAHEEQLIRYGMKVLNAIPGVRVFGPPKPEEHSGVLSFWMDGAHPHDIADIMNSEAVSIRAGHHCAMPLMMRLQVPATNRASVYVYNSEEDLDALGAGLQKVRSVFRLT